MREIPSHALVPFSGRSAIKTVLESNPREARRPAERGMVRPQGATFLPNRRGFQPFPGCRFRRFHHLDSCFPRVLFLPKIGAQSLIESYRTIPRPGPSKNIPLHVGVDEEPFVAKISKTGMNAGSKVARGSRTLRGSEDRRAAHRLPRPSSPKTDCCPRVAPRDTGLQAGNEDLTPSPYIKW